MDRPVPLSLAGLVCLLLVATASVMTAQSLALAADGSYYLVRILGEGDVFGTEARFLGNAIRQAPVLIAARSGLTDTHLHSVLLGVGQLILPAAVWSAAILLARPQRLAFAAVTMTAGICAGTTWFANVSESVLATPLTVLVAVLLWQPAPWRWGYVVVAATASSILVASYETALVTGAVLACWAGWRSADSRSRPDRYGSAIVAVASACSVVAAVAGIVGGPGPTNSQSFLYFVLSGDPWQFYVALAGGVALILGMRPHIDRRQRYWLLGSGGICAAVAVYAFEPTTVTAFQARGGAVLAGFGLQLFLLWLWTQNRGRPPVFETGQRQHVERADSRWLLTVPVLFVAAMAWASLNGLSGWSDSLNAFRTEAGRAQGVDRVDNVLPPDRRQAVWSWTSSSLSLIVRSGADAGILVDSRPSYVPFPPSSARAQLADKYTWGP